MLRTGYEFMRDTMRPVFGDETIDRTGPVWGLDEEGEVYGCYRPSGHPGVSHRYDRFFVSDFRCFQLWYVGGDFVTGRMGSKQLVSSRFGCRVIILNFTLQALQIKAIELGLMKV